MNWINRKVYMYNVTLGLYMLDWWERYLFNTLILMLLWFICHNGSRFTTEIYNRSKFVSEFSSEGPSFTAMEAASSTVPTNVEAASNTVPTIVVYVTVPSKEAGEKLSESIIKERLAACVNRVPGIESVYWWEGKVQTDSEELLIIKTREALLDALTEHVKSNHEYEVPEVIALPINGGNLKYLEWIKNNTREN